jgi:hypothetical protein
MHAKPAKRSRSTDTVHHVCIAALLLALTMHGTPHAMVAWLLVVALIAYRVAAHHVSEHLEARRYAHRKMLRARAVRHAMR